MKVYAFSFSSSLYEEGPRVISIHATKAGAYRAMRDRKLEEWEIEQNWWDKMFFDIKEYEVQE